MLPLMTSEVILNFIKKMRLYNVSIHIKYKFDQNWFINKYARKKKAKSHGVPEFFLVRYRRTYILNKLCVYLYIDIMKIKRLYR